MPGENGARDKQRYPWHLLVGASSRVTIVKPKRSARIAASAYAGRHGFAIEMRRTKAGNLVVERTT